MTVVVTMSCDCCFVHSGVFGGVTSGEEAPVARESPVDSVPKRRHIPTALHRLEEGGEYRVMVCEAESPSMFYCHWHTKA